MSVSSNSYIPTTEDSRLSSYVLKSNFENSFFTNNLSTTNLTCSNSSVLNTLGSNENLPSSTVGSALGTGGTISINSSSNNLYGSIVLNTGSTPAVAGNIICSITLTNSFTSTSSYIVNINQANSLASYKFYAQPTLVNKFNIFCSSTLPASTNNLMINYLIFGN